MIAQAETLLVCLDFDGTIAELNPDPYAVAPHPQALDAIAILAALPRTEVAILSGRHLEGLKQVFPLREPVRLIGSHGAEPGPALTDEEKGVLVGVEKQLRELARDGAYVEVKPYQRVLHVAQVADRARARQLLDAALSIPGPKTPGHNVVEFSVLEVTKGSWLKRHKQGFAATVFIGDDVTDDTALAVLGPGDVGLKVGVDLAGVDAVAEYLTDLAAQRQRFCQQ